MSAEKAADATGKRFFDMLEPESKERIVLMKTKYNLLMPLERNAFLQEVGLVAVGDLEGDAAKGAGGAARQERVPHYHSTRLAIVQSRDPGYVTLQQDVNPPADDADALSPFAEAGAKANEAASVVTAEAAVAACKQAKPDDDFRKMLTPAIFGESKAEVRMNRRSIYEKVDMDGQGSADIARARAERAARLSQAALEAGDVVVAPIGVPGEYNYRSSAYQALRLAHSLPGHLNIRPGTADDRNTPNPLNVTGMPMYEDELRNWFNHLDADHTGQLDLAQFNAFMRSLERDFGVTEEYNMLAKEGERLASDEKLGFEAFAYLVMRFIRV